MNKQVCDIDSIPSMQQAETLESLGRVYLKLNDVKKSNEYFEQAKKINQNWYKYYLVSSW